MMGQGSDVLKVVSVFKSLRGRGQRSQGVKVGAAPISHLALYI